MYNILEYNFSYVCRRACLMRDSSSSEVDFQGVNQICAQPWRATVHSIISNFGRQSPKCQRDERKPRVWQNWIFFVQSQLYLQMFTMGGQVLLFMSFLVYRGASHRHTYTHVHKCTYTQAAGGDTPLIRGFNWFKPPRDQQSSLPKCPWARRCISTTSDPTDWGRQARGGCCVLGHVVPSGGHIGGSSLLKEWL